MPRISLSLRDTALTLLLASSLCSAPARAEVAVPPPADGSRPSPPAPRAPPSTARVAEDDDTVMARILAGITRVSPAMATMTRSTRALILSNLRLMSRVARAVPAEADGAMGYRISGMRSRSVLAALGLRNGDILLGINGRPTSSPQEVLAAYAGLRSASTWTLRIHRGGSERTLTVSVEDDLPAAAPAPGAPAATP